MPLQARPASASDTPLPCTLCPARQGCGKGLWEPLQYATEYTEKTHLLLVTVLAKGVLHTKRRVTVTDHSSTSCTRVIVVAHSSALLCM